MTRENSEDSFDLVGPPPSLHIRIYMYTRSSVRGVLNLTKVGAWGIRIFPNFLCCFCAFEVCLSVLRFTIFLVEVLSNTLRNVTFDDEVSSTKWVRLLNMVWMSFQ